MATLRPVSVVVPKNGEEEERLSLLPGANDLKRRGGGNPPSDHHTSLSHVSISVGLWMITILEIVWLALLLLPALDTHQTTPLQLITTAVAPAVATSVARVMPLTMSAHGSATEVLHQTHMLLQQRLLQQTNVTMLPPWTTTTTGMVVLDAHPYYPRTAATAAPITIDLPAVSAQQILLFASHLAERAEHMTIHVLMRLPVVTLMLIAIVELPLLAAITMLIISSTRRAPRRAIRVVVRVAVIITILTRLALLLTALIAWNVGTPPSPLPSINTTSSSMKRDQMLPPNAFEALYHDLQSVFAPHRLREALESSLRQAFGSGPVEPSIIQSLTLLPISVEKAQSTTSKKNSESPIPSSRCTVHQWRPYEIASSVRMMEDSNLSPHHMVMASLNESLHSCLNPLLPDLLLMHLRANVTQPLLALWTHPPRPSSDAPLWPTIQAQYLTLHQIFDSACTLATSTRQPQPWLPLQFPDNSPRTLSYWESLLLCSQRLPAAQKRSSSSHNSNSASVNSSSNSPHHHTLFILDINFFLFKLMAIYTLHLLLWIVYLFVIMIHSGKKGERTSTTAFTNKQPEEMNSSD